MINLSTIPLFQKLENSQNILISGAGGGFDIYCGLPLYFALKAQGKNVILGNLSFTLLSNTSATEVFPSCWKIKATNQVLNGYNYFPEKYLAEWFLQQGELLNMYAFEKTGANTLKNAFNFIKNKHQIDTVILIDGGTDSLLHGDEEELGTPTEDSCSLAGAFCSAIPHKFLVCLGFGVDHYHGVSHYLFLENVATLIRTGGFLGTFQLMKEMVEFEKYKQAVAYANGRMRLHPSIVSNSIISAIEGNYGDYHQTDRTKGSELWINPFMGIYWCFQLNEVVQQLKYFDYIKSSSTFNELKDGLAEFRHTLTDFRDNKRIPI
ncbi:MAG TPA: DUF1152 domain-containing protein [Emticicia sp.]